MGRRRALHKKKVQSGREGGLMPAGRCFFLWLWLIVIFLLLLSVIKVLNLSLVLLSIQ